MNINQGAKHIWLPYTQMQNHLPQLEVVSAKGSKIFLQDGRTLIDGIASWWSAAHGYNHPHLTKAIAKQAKILPHIMLAGFANDQTYKLAWRLAKLTKLDRVFFSDSGSTAIEVAMKICWQYYINLQQPQKTKFVSFKNSYHGDTTGAMSLGDLSHGMHEKFSKILINNFSLNLPQNKNDLDQFEDFVKKNQHKIAGVFVEPLVQCAGGMKFHKAEILRKIFLITKKYNLLFIADECATGFYRTGKIFACDHAKITPDIMVLGKALTGGYLTLAATIVSEKIFASFLGDSPENALMHGPTFMGNPLAAAAANASLDLFEKNDYEKKVTKIETFLIKNLKKYRNHKNVKDVRVIGALGVIETDLEWKDMMNLRKKFIEQGVFLRPFAGVIYVMPSLNISSKELRIIIDAIEEALRQNL
ncbi:MAG: adenosylmethionine--8-amino-7-oxononanoate transaminase [Rickettsiales bacterium]|nr:adenosylmethionine--8-amino-7-oxononanoate transaminase [Rickettsiales bacterium]